MLFIIVAFVFNLLDVNAKMEPFVVGGERAAIEYYAHSVFLSIRDHGGAFICGSSILNQKVVLTAAHCFESCKDPGKIYAFVGNANRGKGKKYQVANFKLHEQYDSHEVSNDISLAVLRKPISLGKFAKRVSILRRPPNKKMAAVAGWGLVDEYNAVKSPWLHSTNQKIWSLAQCRRVLPGIPNGCLCAGDVTTEDGYASEGDSGSALVVNEYIQVGIVSFKRPETARALVVYTNVSHFYNWIKLNSRILFCNEKLG